MSLCSYRSLLSSLLLAVAGCGGGSAAPTLDGGSASTGTHADAGAPAEVDLRFKWVGRVGGLTLRSGTNSVDGTELTARPGTAYSPLLLQPLPPSWCSMARRW